MMDREFLIRFHGTAPGLEDGRLSIAKFRKPLAKLLAAFQHIITDLQGLPETSAGKLSAAAKLLDLQIAEIDHNCTALHIVAVKQKDPSREGLRVDDAVVAQGLLALGEALQSEGTQGAPVTNRFARAFYDALPSQVERVDGDVLDGGVAVRTFSATIRAAGRRKKTKEEWRLTTTTTRLVGVEFQPLAIRLRRQGKLETIPASRKLVDAAVAIVDGDVEVRFTSKNGRPQRLVSIRRAGERPAFDLSASLADTDRRHADLLRALAK